MPLTGEERKRFKEAMTSATTRSSTSSHVKKIAFLLRREKGLTAAGSDEQVLLDHVGEEDVETVGAALAAENISSGANYLCTWAGKIADKKMVPATFSRRRFKVARALRKFGPPCKQAVELPIVAMHSSSLLLRRVALHPGGLVFPVLALVVLALLMLRGIATRSFLRKQVVVHDDRVEVIFGRRKNCQHGAKEHKILELHCMCAFSLCPRCLLAKYMELIVEVPGKRLFSSSRGGVISERALRQTFQEAAKQFGLGGATPHAGRVTGARYWNSKGVSEANIALLGDWKSIASLRRYLGTASLSSNMLKEMEARRPTVSSLPSAVGLPPLVEAALNKMIEIPNKDELAIVYRRRPRRWHRVKPHGPSCNWFTWCGDRYNAATMDIQLWQEFDPNDGVQCTKCTG